ncbi:DotH/IcmK family type IV secretion protein [Citrobacter freundii]|uniref:DotH/IcmK family type IV secretion protein n=1 Tax=Citrobacter freundii TaxID=546 RepID=UPI0019074DAC|nr:DotH/IcmK family type IV secretion protein [Citrobacter freundii]MBJ8931595.1 type IV secretion protein DotH [Citrobacter freundii]
MKIILTVIFIFITYGTAYAEGQQPTSAIKPSSEVTANVPTKNENADKETLPEDIPPKSNLGVQDEQPQVVYPSPEQINSDVMSDLERSQLTPEQRKKVKALNLEQQRDTASPYVNPPIPVTRSLIVDLNAGISPPVVRLAKGQSTSLVFSDMGGQPWYIDRASINCTLFSVPQCRGGNKESGSSGESEKTNVLTIEPNTPVAYGNVTVVLKGLPTPVIFILTSGQKEVDMRLDAKIPGSNPNSQAELSVQSLPTIDDSLTQFLDGVPPKSAKKMRVSGAEQITAWKYQDRLYVRANADALYPAYTNSARSTTGMSVYRFDEIYSSITFTAGGQAITAYIEE